MTDMRRHFHEDLERMEAQLLAMGETASGAVEKAASALLSDDPSIAEAVVTTAHRVDAEAIEFERHWLQTMALQTPVAVDLRLMSVFLNCNHSLQRIGHQAANIAKIEIATRGMPHHPPIDAQIREMGERVVPMLRLALEAFQARDVTAVERLQEMDQPVNDLNRNIYKLVVECSRDTAKLEWATRMMVVARALERVGDRAVSIAQQVHFLVSGSYDEELE